jgi:hypothetical protein
METGKMDIRQIVTRYGPMIDDPNIFIYPNIPEKRLLSALEVFAKEFEAIDPDAVIALVDNTVRGNAKDGAVLTVSHFFIHNMMEKPVRFPLSSLETVSFKEGWTSKLFLNGNIRLDINVPKKDSMRVFTRMFDEIAVAVHQPEPVFVPVGAGAQPGPSPIEALKKLKALFDAGILTEEEYRVKREKYVSQL